MAFVITSDFDRRVLKQEFLGALRVGSVVCLPLRQDGGHLISLSPDGETPALCPLFILKGGLSVLPSWGSQNYSFKGQFLRLLEATRTQSLTGVLGDNIYCFLGPLLLYLGAKRSLADSNLLFTKPCQRLICTLYCSMGLQMDARRIHSLPLQLLQFHGTLCCCQGCHFSLYQ